MKTVVSVILLTVLMAACAVTPEQKGAKYFKNGKALMEKKDYARAILEFKNAVRVMPQNAEAYYQLGLSYLAIGDTRSGVSSLKRATELDPRHVGAQLRLAEMELASTNQSVLGDAQKRIESLSLFASEDPEVADAMALSDFRLGKPEEAEQRLEEAIRKFPSNLKVLENLAALKLGKKDFEGAEAVLKQAVARTPQAVEPLKALGTFYLIVGRNADAEAAFRRAVEIDSKDGPALLDLAKLQITAGHNKDAEGTLSALSALPDPQYRHLHAQFLLIEHKYDEALKEFEDQFKTAPGDRAVRTRLIQAFLLTNRAGDAQRIVDEALKKNPKDIDSRMDRSGLYAARGRLAEAQSDLTEVLRAEPNSANAHFLQAKLHHLRGSELLRRQELGEAVRLDRRLLAARIELADSLLSAHSAGAALDLLEKAPDDQRESLAFTVERNWVLLALGDRKSELRKILDRSLANQKSAELFFQDGLLRLQEKDVAGGRRSLEQALAVNPQDARPLEVLARSYAAEKQPAAALAAVQRYALQKPNSAGFQYLLGRWEAETADFQAARKAYEAALRANPKFWAAKIRTAELDAQQGNFAAATQTLEVVASVPTQQAQAELLLGMIVEAQSGDPGSAIGHYRKVLEVDPDNTLALNNLAYHLAADDKQLDQALAYAQRLGALSPGDAEADDTIGWIYYRKGLFPTAVKYLEGAAKKAPTALHKYHLSIAYARAGNTGGAHQMLEQALKLDPHIPEALAAQKVVLP